MDEFSSENGTVKHLKGMYNEYFLDYASYVILERAVPYIEDGLKPVQRRLLHALKNMDDGRFHKVANVIGQTMQYHPHGDMSIGDALVKLGQKDLLIDCQGNWGDVRTGDRAAASRYIEARLTKFALAVMFNAQTTNWQLSYDGRKKEPVTLPAKFPLLLAQGTEGIAVGLSTKILPHNFLELLKASIKILEEKPFKIYPDFQTGGEIDISDYNKGKRGGKVKVRAKINIIDKSTITITELPFAVTTNSLIDSILKANDKGQIKIKKVVDNTAKDVEIRIELQKGFSPDKMKDALFAFTSCEVSISPNACVIVEEKPHFLDVHHLLKISTENTKELLLRELKIRQAELEEKLHFASLEKVFIQERIYRDIEESETWEDVISTIDKGLKKYFITPSDTLKPGDNRIQLLRDITEEDITRLTEIRIKRISKYNSFKADALIKQFNEELNQVKHDIIHIVDYAIAYFQNLIDKFGKGRERRTIISTFDEIKVSRVVSNNAKLYVNYKEGFIGTDLKKDTFVKDCSDIDNVIAFKKDGTFKVVKISDKVFVGKNITHVDIWRKSDDRMTYNLVYLDGTNGRTMAKRFNVTSVTRDKDYPVIKGDKNSKVLYFSVNPNGEGEILSVQLTQNCTARKKSFDFDMSEIAIKGRGAGGNIVSKYPVRKITRISQTKSTLGGIKIWIDDVSGKINKSKRGRLLGEFDTGDHLLAIYKDGSYEVETLNFDKRWDVDKAVSITKLEEDTVISAIYYHGEKKWTVVKRFKIETNKVGQNYLFIDDSAKSKLLFATIEPNPKVTYSMRIKGQKMEGALNLAEFIEVKGWKSMGNKFSDSTLTGITLVPPEIVEPPKEDKKEEGLKPGDSIDLDPNQGELF